MIPTEIITNKVTEQANVTISFLICSPFFSFITNSLPFALFFNLLFT